ncbi:UTP--glucose-1-phosphate uridylyltransferase GalU [Kordiimonas sp. SCSIO 12603]|uniref:UTP--glucose-1-phosphate uridylyltransferase GalU n=1 Tax=Kordiimonas sp. SCSIO 12603 TaxID=2829596 RepID=UPI0021025BC1|nr:UTP--glucose-1-phosphate uridylyltransferase GalU [Kordiimonas sp. SCSIO 12603]UTW60063.1 UTP--glucose-1-phosphate uridylyltransferase GalU [Kordiimonas sp. SCSIO 12603]
MIKPVKKIVLPVAGLGTRFLPATKAIPKEMLPVLDKPLIQYAVEEALEAGIEEIILVTGRNKQVMEDHFDHAYELERILQEKGKEEALEISRSMLLEEGRITYVRQMRPRGLGHAIWCARSFVNDSPFAVALPDDLIKGKPGVLKQMIQAYNEVGGNIIATMDVAKEDTSKYGVITPGESSGKLTEVKGLVEKPHPEDAPSTEAVVGRYILQPEVMDHLAAKEIGAGGEIQLTDALDKLIGNQPFHALNFEGKRFDCGSKIGWLMANLSMAGDDPILASQMRQLITFQ